MRVISFLNPKGGSGKTTLSTNLARAFGDQGRRALLVDSDPQGSARDWHAAREDNPIPLVALDRPNNLKNLASVGAAYDVVLVDGAAKLSHMISAAVTVSDAVLIPVQPSPYDIWSVADLVDLIKARQEITGRPSAAFLVSRVIRHTKLGREISDALADYALPVFRSVTVQRQVYPQTAAEGLTVFDGPQGPAAAEISAIAAELDAFLEGDSHAESATA